AAGRARRGADDARRGARGLGRRRPARGAGGRGRDRQVAARARAPPGGGPARADGGRARGRGRGVPSGRGRRDVLGRGGSRAGPPRRRLADASLRAPELARPGLPAPMEMSGPAAQTRLLDAIAAVLGVARLVFVDDLHAADEATLDVLAYLGRRLRGRGLLLL